MSLTDADERFLRTTRTLTDEHMAEPSLLPDWSRAHVLAHVALNADGMARVLEGLRAGEAPTMYDSDAARDADIETLAAAAPAQVRERVVTSTERLASALEWLSTASVEGVTFERVPGGISFTAASLPERRMAEVEIHHADLGAGYTAADWPNSFTTELLERRRQRGNWETDFVAQATDLDHVWRFGSPGSDAPTVSGQSHALAWWLTGRGTGAGLSSTHGDLPVITGF